MFRANATKGGLMVLACLATVALVSSWTSPKAEVGVSPRSAAQTSSHSSETLLASQVVDSLPKQDAAMADLATRVAIAYRPEGGDWVKFRLASAKLTLEDVTTEGLAEDYGGKDLVSDMAAFRKLLLAPPALIPVWPEEAVRKTYLPDTEPHRVLSLSDPIPSMTTPGRYFFLSGEGPIYYENLGLLTVDVPADGGELKWRAEPVMALHPPMNGGD